MNKASEGGATGMGGTSRIPMQLTVHALVPVVSKSGALSVAVQSHTQSDSPVTGSGTLSVAAQPHVQTEVPPRISDSDIFADVPHVQTETPDILMVLLERAPLQVVTHDEDPPI